MRHGASGNVCADARGAPSGSKEVALAGARSTEPGSGEKGNESGDLGTDIYGVHFGGGWGLDASFAIGSLSGSDLTVWGAQRCDSHLDLLEAIVYFNGPWGLDFPVVLPARTYQTFSNRDWPDLLDFAGTFEEVQVSHPCRHTVSSSSTSSASSLGSATWRCTSSGVRRTDMASA